MKMGKSFIFNLVLQLLKLFSLHLLWRDVGEGPSSAVPQLHPLRRYLTEAY